MNWFEVQLLLPAPMKDSVINRLFELGAEGVTDGDDSVKGYFEEKNRSAVDRDLKAYLDSITEFFPGHPPVEVKFQSVEKTNWADRYKEFYFAQQLSHLFFLKPAWDETTVVPEGLIPIVMEPGQAFGTGLHMSTQLCMRLVEDAVEMFKRPEAIRVLDVGTGTGILSIVAAKLGVQKVTAVDIDPIAVDTAKENFVLNACTQIETKVGDLSGVEGPFEVIVSNILLETHLQLAPLYREKLAPGGQLILSGLLTPQKAELLEAMKVAGLVEETSKSSQEWLAMTLRHQS